MQKFHADSMGMCLCRAFRCAHNNVRHTQQCGRQIREEALRAGLTKIPLEAETKAKVQ